MKKTSKKTAAKKPAKSAAAPAKANGKPTAEAKPAKAAEPKTLGKRAAILAAAQAGKVPAAPDFSAATHTRFRPTLAAVVALVKAGDLKKLKSYQYEGFMSSSPKAIMRYRDLAIVALEARK